MALEVTLLDRTAIRRVTLVFSIRRQGLLDTAIDFGRYLFQVPNHTHQLLPFAFGVRQMVQLLQKRTLAPAWHLWLPEAYLQSGHVVRHTLQWHDQKIIQSQIHLQLFRLAWQHPCSEELDQVSVLEEVLLKVATIGSLGSSDPRDPLGPTLNVSVIFENDPA